MIGVQYFFLMKGIRFSHIISKLFVLINNQWLRFLYDAQIAQLSKWMRPRVKKYSSTFVTVKKDFEDFLNIVSKDPLLRYVVSYSLCYSYFMYISLFIIYNIAST